MIAPSSRGNLIIGQKAAKKEDNAALLDSVLIFTIFSSSAPPSSSASALPLRGGHHRRRRADHLLPEPRRGPPGRSPETGQGHPHGRPPGQQYRPAVRPLGWLGGGSSGSRRSQDRNRSNRSSGRRPPLAALSARPLLPRFAAAGGRVRAVGGARRYFHLGGYGPPAVPAPLAGGNTPVADGCLFAAADARLCGGPKGKAEEGEGVEGEEAESAAAVITVITGATGYDSLKIVFFCLSLSSTSKTLNI